MSSLRVGSTETSQVAALLDRMLDGCALYEPVHGSAPDIAGQGVANPLGTILSVAMMFRHSFGRPQEAAAIETAVDQTLVDGFRTPDILVEGARRVDTSSMGAAVIARIDDSVTG